MKIPRNLSGEELKRKLLKIGYNLDRQKGSHIRLTKKYIDGEHHLTIPNHNPIKIGTLNNIISDLAYRMKTSKEEVLNQILD